MFWYNGFPACFGMIEYAPPCTEGCRPPIDGVCALKLSLFPGVGCFNRFKVPPICAVFP